MSIFPFQPLSFLPSGYRNKENGSWRIGSKLGEDRSSRKQKSLCKMVARRSKRNDTKSSGTNKENNNNNEKAEVELNTFLDELSVEGR